jgi:hypothetical protein
MPVAQVVHGLSLSQLCYAAPANTKGTAYDAFVLQRLEWEGTSAYPATHRPLISDRSAKFYPVSACKTVMMPG